MISYKGFNRDMTCRGKQYEEGKTYKEERAEACNTGMHACEYPLDCFRYYAPGSSVYHQAIQGGILSKHEKDSKVASTEMTIGKRLNIRELVHAAIEYTKSRTATEYTDPQMATAGDYGAATAGDCGAATAGCRGSATAGDCGAATAGDYGAAMAGDYGAATAGDRGAATAGDYGAATAGDCGAATAGDYGAATAGDRGAATAGYFGAVTAGDYGAATAGDRGAANSRGSSSVGENGAALVRGRNVRAKGGIGSLLVIVEDDENYDIKDWKAVVVDGTTIKADTWYKLVDGELVSDE